MWLSWQAAYVAHVDWSKQGKQGIRLHRIEVKVCYPIHRAITVDSTPLPTRIDPRVGGFPNISLEMEFGDGFLCCLSFALSAVPHFLVGMCFHLLFMLRPQSVLNF